MTEVLSPQSIEHVHLRKKPPVDQVRRSNFSKASINAIDTSNMTSNARAQGYSYFLLCLMLEFKCTPRAFFKPYHFK